MYNTVIVCILYFLLCSMFFISIIISLYNKPKNINIINITNKLLLRTFTQNNINKNKILFLCYFLFLFL